MASKFFDRGRQAFLSGRSHYWDNPYPEGSPRSREWFSGFMKSEPFGKIRLEFQSRSVAENGVDTPGLITHEHFIGIANYDGSLVKVFDLKIQERPPKSVYQIPKSATKKLITTVRFWAVDGSTQGSGTVETKAPPFLSAIEAMREAGVSANIDACEGVENESEKFKKLFTAVGELIKVPDPIYNFEVF